MALNTANPIKQVTSTTADLATKAGSPAQLVVDTTKQTFVLMDGSTLGGHPMAKEARKIKAGTPNVKINGGTEANLGGDLTITVLPGTVPGGFVMVTDPEGQPAGKYLQISYTDTDGNPAKYYIDMSSLVDEYVSGPGIKITGNSISVDPSSLVGGDGADGSDGVVAPGGGLVATEDGKLKVDISELVDTSEGSPFQIVDGKLTINIVSADAGNNISKGTDGGAFFPSDLGTL